MLAVIVSVTSTVVPASASTTHHSVAGLIAHTTGKTLGPNGYTDWGKATISSYSSYYDCNRHETYWRRSLSMKQYPNPLGVQAVGAQTGPPITLSGGVSGPNSCPSGPVRMTLGPDGMMHPDSWYNPASWDWGGILGSVWDRVISRCLSGAQAGVVPAASGTLIVNIIARGGKVFVGPEGYAAIAVGGCVMGVFY